VSIEIKKWDDTEASKCRWSSYAEPLVCGSWSEGAVLFDASESDYQGTVEIVFADPGLGGYCGDPSELDGARWVYLEYSYGSCSGCDRWEGEPSAKIAAAMARLCLPFNDLAGLLAHLQRIADDASTEDDYDPRDRSKKARALIAALNATKETSNG
jgi:hypothetical protein